MAVSHVVDTHAYDVLGVSPNASAKEIDDAFHRLIEEGGYRIGVPLRGQWQRAREIKQAYAALRGPAERRVYDESLEGTSERTLWPASPQTHPAEDPLVQSLSEELSPPEPATQSITTALGSGEREPEHASVGAIESGDDEIVPNVDQLAPWPGEGCSRNEVKSGSPRLWGSAAAATLALGTLLYFTWPSGKLQPSPEVTAQLPAGAPQVNSSAPMTGRLAKLPPPVVDATRTVETEVPAAATAKVAIASETRTSPGPAAAKVEVASATAPALAPVSSAPTSMAAEPAASGGPAPAPPFAQPPSVAPPTPGVAPPQVRTSVDVPPAAGEVNRPAQLIGGGPTHSDNRRGRYVGSVVVQFTVQADGRVSGCGTARSSGKAELDALTCRLVEERMRFKPALDAQGIPVASTAHARYEWGRRPRYPSLFAWLFR